MITIKKTKEKKKIPYLATQQSLKFHGKHQDGYWIHKHMRK